MPDIDTSFYPKAPTNDLGHMSPTGVVGLVGGINNIQRQQIENEKSRLELGNYKNQLLQETFAPLAAIEDPKEFQAAVYSATAQAARKGLPDAEAKEVMDHILAGGDLNGMRRRAAALGISGLGAKSLEPVTSGYDPNTGQPLPAPYGAKILRSLPPPSAAPQYGSPYKGPNLGPIQPKGAGGAPSLRQPAGAASFEPPEGLQATTAEAQKTFQNDQKLAQGTLANLRNLDIALPMIEKLNSKDFGPGSPGYSNVRRAFITAGIIDPNKTDIPDREQVNKYLLKYATLAQNAGRSDQALGAALNSNPNIDLTQPANLHLIKNQIGLDKMEAARPSIFRVEHPNSYDLVDYPNYGPKYQNKVDWRVFSYDKLNPQERRELITSLGGEKSAAYKKFHNSYELAKKAGFITPEKSQ